MVGELAPGSIASAWPGKTVFITGHSGFVGSWLSTLLRRVGVNVVGYSLSEDPSSASRATWLKALGVVTTDGDVRDFEGLLAAVDGAKPDIVVHLAAQPILGRGFSAPHLTFDVNVNGSLNVLEVVRRTSTQALVHVTSDKCYSPAAASQGAVTEDSDLGGESPYPSSKMIAEILFQEFSDLAGEDGPWMASVRLGNVVGGGDEADRLVPNCLRSFRAGRPFAVRDPLAVRPFQHVLDVVHGLALLGQALLERRIPSGTPLNFAPPHMGLTTADLVAALAAAWGPGAACVSEREDIIVFPEQQVLRLDGSRAAELLGWHHQLDLSRTAGWTVEWAQLVDQGVPPSTATTEQVAGYLAESADAP
jgi:CDP-glucose 4,6-dehydratase